MNNKYKALLATALVSPMLLTTSCIEEVLPTNGVVQEQLQGNLKATEALLWAMPAHYNQIGTITTSVHYDWGQGAIMHARDVMTDDMSIMYSGYNHFSTWCEAGIGLNDGYMAAQFIWNFQTEQVLTTNKLVAAIDADTPDPDLQSYLGAGLVFRASTYLDMARMYEFLPNENVSSINRYNNNVEGLTVPIVTEQTTEEQARNNPRAPHDEMVKFILGDLQQAEALLKKGSARTSKTVPDLAVCYGVMARLYLWDATYHEMGYAHAGTGNAADLYRQAAYYADLAITTSKATPTSQEEWLNPTTGFNQLSTSSWMWGMQYTDEDNAVASGLLNWTAWMSNEAEFGYAIAGPYVMIGASTYRRINDRDFRKLSYIAPSGSSLSGRETLIDPDQREDIPEYASLKFRPGSGNLTDNNIACVVGIPLMRVEEMYFIKAEALAHNNPTEGMIVCSDFMKRYRYATYASNATTVDEVVDEIVFQKRVELWGEGLSYFDYKRLNMGVDRTYAGTNFNWGADTYKITGRPYWMNFVISQQETDSNRAIQEFNNPNCGERLKPEAK